MTPLQASTSALTTLDLAPEPLGKDTPTPAPSETTLIFSPLKVGTDNSGGIAAALTFFPGITCLLTIFKRELA